MTTLNPYINFPGNTREAMTFYQECLGGELVLQAVSDSPIAAQMPEASKDGILHSQLTAGGIIINASDMNPNPKIGSNISLMIQCSSDAEIRNFYEKLSAGGEIYDELKVQFWGDTFGCFKDKFGTIWLLNLPKTKVA